MSQCILIVDDSATIRQQIQTFLSEHDFETLEAADGAEGLAAARTRRADLIVVDINMPGMGGIEMISEVRKLQGYESVPIFVLTTESTRTMADEGKAAGASAWIVKPVNPENLLKGIRHALSRAKEAEAVT